MHYSLLLQFADEDILSIISVFYRHMTQTMQTLSMIQDYERMRMKNESGLFF